MSEANDDLLSYELGDDLDDQELAGDEDALLLSDEEAQLDFEEDLPPTKTSTQTHCVENKIELVDDQRVEEEQQSQTCTAVEILEEPHKPEEEPQPAEEEQQQICQFTVEQPVTNDEECVSSTNECPKESDSENFSAPPDSDTSPSKRSSKEDLDYSSFDNDDEPRERHNPKTTSERDLNPPNMENDFRNRNQGFQRGGRGGGRGGPPFRGGRFGRGGGGGGGVGPYNQQPNQFYPNENFNPMNGGPPQQHIDFVHQGPAGPMMGNRMPGPPPQMMHRPQLGGGMRPDFRPNMNYHQRPPFPNDVRPMMRPPFDPQQPTQLLPHYTNNNNGGPMNAYRSHQPDPMNMGPRGAFPGNNFGPNNFNRMHRPQQFRAPQQQQMPPYQQQQQQLQPQISPQRPPMMNRVPMMNPQMGGPMNAPSAGPAGMAPMMPRKVLINPNFKGGGVEAATNQLMKDTMGSAVVMPSAMSDEALLRQQEEFINQNRMHIEKQRRHDRSPEPRKRDYSPPPSSHRDRLHGGRHGRGGRGHSPGHRGTGRPVSPKRRRSMDGNAPAMSTNPVAPAAVSPADPDEDEETRAYRLKIEKQKAMRDKILRDKEMRRRRAAEQKEARTGTREDGPTTTTSSAMGTQQLVKERAVSPKQFTPLVVTEKKIISLKRGLATKRPNSSHTDEPRQESPKIKRVVVQRRLKAVGSAVTAAATTVKPVVIKRSLENDSDEFDEDELLADSPPPPPPPPPSLSSLTVRSLTPPVKVGSRRIVLASSGRTKAATSTTEATSTASKGVFDRLEKRVGVSEVAKRKLKRIVIKHLE